MFLYINWLLVHDDENLDKNNLTTLLLNDPLVRSSIRGSRAWLIKNAQGQMFLRITLSLQISQEVWFTAKCIRIEGRFVKKQINSRAIIICKESERVGRVLLGDQAMQLIDYAREIFHVIDVCLLTREQFCRDKVFKVMIWIQAETSMFFLHKHKEM